MQDFGARLREARERKGISLRQIASATKISAVALQGLERNDISKLPGGIFSRAFVRSYAIEVGLDPDETVRDFLQQFGLDSSAAPIAAPAAAARPQPAPGAPHELSEEVDFESKQRMAGVVLKLLLVSVPVVSAILYFSTRSARPVAQADGMSGRRSAASTAQAVPPAPDVARVEGSPHDTVRGGTVVSAEPFNGAAADTATPPDAAVAPVLLEIAPTGDCWVQLSVDGATVLSRVILEGERERREFKESAVLQVGDAAACVLAINGDQARPLGAARQVREIHLTRDNYRTFLP